MAAATPGLRPVLPAIDWAAPWFAPWRAGGQRVARAVRQGQPLHEALDAEGRAAAGCGPSVRFVPQSTLPAREPYERFIFEQGCCPTREGLHDFFNGLCWLRLPQAKRQLNALHAAHIAAHGIGPRRGAVRDAITVFDENAALLQAPPPLWEALIAHDWRHLFVTLRPLWRKARLLVFGHAALEKLVFPWKGITVHVWQENAAMESVADLDAWLAWRLQAGALAAKPFTPLPVLGVPGWWAGNENFSFYDDAQVFRPRKAGSAVACTHWLLSLRPACS